MVLLSLFADPERILRRLYVFAEEPCKSTTTTSEPCSPVFKEAQPRPSESINQSSSALSTRISTVHFNCSFYLIIVHNVFLLLVIYVCNKASDRIVSTSKDSVFSPGKPLSPEVSRLSPFTHVQQHTRTSRTFYTFAISQPNQH